MYTLGDAVPGFRAATGRMATRMLFEITWSIRQYRKF
jgi:hypothetical protein